jgi:hypothetical protein
MYHHINESFLSIVVYFLGALLGTVFRNTRPITCLRQYAARSWRTKAVLWLTVLLVGLACLFLLSGQGLYITGSAFCIFSLYGGLIVSVVYKWGEAKFPGK